LNSVLIDTSFLITLADPARVHHQAAQSYLREALRRGVPLYFSTIVASEFQVKQPVTDLPLRNFVVLPFNIDHAMQAGLLMREILGINRQPEDRREVVKEDVKLIAQGICESITHLLTEDKRTLARYVEMFNQSGLTLMRCVLLADGYDDAWFNGGQRGLLPPSDA
jgi:hypothetical protein